MTFDNKTVVLSRPVAGIACRIRIAARQYQAVAVLARETGNVIRLMHREPGLSVDLAEMADFPAAEEYCERVADFLKLPPLMLAGGEAKDAPETEQPQGSPRRTRPLRTRRPRFLARRQTGEPISIRMLEKREIIARH